MTDPQFALQCAIVDIQSQIGQAVTNVQHELTRPFMMVRPVLSKDGDHWCFLFGEDLQEGVAGFGKTPAEAATAFDKAWWNETIKLHGNRLSSKNSGERDGLTVSTGSYVSDEHGTPITGLSWCAAQPHEKNTSHCPACGVGPLEACRGRVPQDDEAPKVSMNQALADIAAERRRQTEAEGWSPQHDDEHDAGVLAAAGAAYALNAGDQLHPISQGDGGNQSPSFWPFEASWWKPSDPRRDLVKFGALIVAEIEKIDRAAAATATEVEL